VGVLSFLALSTLIFYVTPSHNWYDSGMYAVVSPAALPFQAFLSWELNFPIVF
jgi:hypothetical protein